ncbi:MAG: HAD family phosphatase [Acidobacteria bacterium]|nr:HAD family phosphatase [Acidobacteriota bacterium]
MISISTVIFDYGNVLCQPQPSEMIQEMANLCDIPTLQFQAGYYQFRHQYDLGFLDGSGYWQAFGSVAGFQISESTVEKLIALDNRSWAEPNFLMLDWVARLQNVGIQTAILSNMPVDMRCELSSLCHWLPKFEVEVYSCELGIAKPDPAIFELCINHLEVVPEEALFVDDRLENIKAAQALGLHSLIFESVELLEVELAGRFHLPPVFSK